MVIEQKRLTSFFGAEIKNLDINCDLSDELFSSICKAFDEYSVLMFSGQEISEVQQIALSERFGDLE